MGYNTITVTTSATLIVSNNSRRQSLIITNTDPSSKLYIGPDSNVTSSTGIEIPISGSFAEDNSGTKVYCGDIYGISTASINVRYWERTLQ